MAGLDPEVSFGLAADYLTMYICLPFCQVKTQFFFSGERRNKRIRERSHSIDRKMTLKTENRGAIKAITEKTAITNVRFSFYLSIRQTGNRDC